VIGWIGLHRTAIAFESSPESIAFTNSPAESAAAASRRTRSMIWRITRCFELWIRRSAIAIGFTRISQASFVVTSNVPSVRVRFLRVSRRT